MPETLARLDLRTLLFVALTVVSLFLIVVFVRGLPRVARARGESATPGVALTVIGAVVNFFDALGIGSFATTTAIVRQWRLVRDEVLPGTLNAGHALPTIAQAFIFTSLVPVEPLTLTGMIVAAVLGSWLGAGVVARMPRRAIQLGMGVALIVFATIVVLRQTGVFPSGGQSLGLSGGLLVAALAGNFALGALMTLGIGLYAPCMIMVALLGMNPTAAFPIMMGSCAFLMPVASARFVREKAVDPRAVISFAIGGIPGSIVAGVFVKELSLTAVYWLVVVVVIYTAVGLLRASRRTDARDVAGTPAPTRAPAVTP